MTFVEPDDFIFLMDYLPGVMTVDDLKRFRGLGVKTGWIPLFWDFVEPRPGEYHWDVLDYLISRYLQADMKVLLLTPHTPIAFGPEEWYCTDREGRCWRDYNGYRDPGWRIGDLSPWSVEARQYERDFVKIVQARYPRTVLPIHGFAHGGEQIVPGMIECWYDPSAVASFRAYARQMHSDDLVRFNVTEHAKFPSWDEVMPAYYPDRRFLGYFPTTTAWLHDSLLTIECERLSTFAEHPAKEIWLSLPERDTEFAEQVETGPRTCNWLAPEMYRDFPGVLGVEINILFYEAFRPQGTQGIFRAVKGLESRVWTGAEYIPGLYKNTETAIEMGLRGFLFGPVHPFSGNQHPTEESYEAVRWSLERWRAARL